MALDSSIVFLPTLPNRPLLMSKFPTPEEARLVNDELDKHPHPNVARVHGVFKDCYMAYNLFGTRLDKMIDKSKFIVKNQFITEFYRQLLCVFFLVTLFTTDDEIDVEWVAKLENIYVREEDGEFMFQLVGFRQGSGKNVTALCKEFSESVLREINERCGWKDTGSTPTEMNELLSYLEADDLDVLRKITYLPIIWNLIERREFVVNMSDCLEESYDSYMKSGHVDVLQNKLSNWHQRLSPALESLKRKCDASEAHKKIGVPVSSQQLTEPIHGLLFFGKICSHFYEYQIQELPDVFSVLYEIETVFPDLIFGLSELARDSNLRFSLPKRDFLEMLFEDTGIVKHVPGAAKSTTGKKRRKTEKSDQIELDLNQAQTLMHPPLSYTPCVVDIEGYNFEEYEESPVIGRPKTIAAESNRRKIRWVRCEDCLKWHKVPPDGKLTWTCTCSKYSQNRRTRKGVNHADYCFPAYLTSYLTSFHGLMVK